MVDSRSSRSPTNNVGALTVGDVIRRVLPHGTGIALKNRAWRHCPDWAPDVFAGAASVVHACSCYAEPGIAFSRNASEREKKKSRAEIHASTGKRWAKSVQVPKLVREHWQTLYEAFDLPIVDRTKRAEKWKMAALALVAISDEAFAGAGYFPTDQDGIANFVWYELLTAAFNRKVALQLPHSMTILASSDVVCVLPKALTPNVGCTLRSLTHNLAYLSGKGIVKPEWLIDPGHELTRRLRGARKHRERLPSSKSAPDGVFNILLVPFPYVVHATDFRVSRPAEKESDGYFTLSQDWLRNGTRRISVKAMADFIAGLVRNAESDAGPIHAIVLPEVALDKTLARGVVSDLGRRFHHLELFITGLVDGAPPSQRNVAAQYRLVDGELVSTVEQSKHHRWRLEESQIRQYQLGGVLDPNHIWWEHIDVHDRRIGFAANQQGAIVSALVCEDLARYDPVLPTVAAVGPTLVLALLLDGPQLTNRWPGRYATVLAEDPGSSVLTLTNLGMIERSAIPARENSSVVGLWKERHGAAKELVLPKGHHALVLSLNLCGRERQVTLDHRVEDNGATVEYRLGASRGVRLDNPPKWLERRANSA